ncbi:MAG: hypothetical protein V1660_00245 [archaeon]
MNKITSIIKTSLLQQLKRYDFSRVFRILKTEYKPVFLIALFSIILAIPLVSAQFYYGSFNPADLLNDQWFIFTAFFAVYFGVIYTSLGKVMGGAAPTLVVSAALAFLISAGMQRNWYLLEQPIMIWAVILIIGLILISFMKFIFGGDIKRGFIYLIGFLIVLMGLWPFYKGFIPMEVIAEMPYSMIEFLDSAWLIALIVGVGILIFFGALKKVRINALFNPATYKKQL